MVMGGGRGKVESRKLKVEMGRGGSKKLEVEIVRASLLRGHKRKVPCFGEVIIVTASERGQAVNASGPVGVFLLGHGGGLGLFPGLFDLFFRGHELGQGQVLSVQKFGYFAVDGLDQGGGFRGCLRGLGGDDFLAFDGIADPVGEEELGGREAGLGVGFRHPLFLVGIPAGAGGSEAFEQRIDGPGDAFGLAEMFSHNVGVGVLVRWVLSGRGGREWGGLGVGGGGRGCAKFGVGLFFHRFGFFGLVLWLQGNGEGFRRN